LLGWFIDIDILGLGWSTVFITLCTSIRVDGRWRCSIFTIEIEPKRVISDTDETRAGVVGIITITSHGVDACAWVIRWLEGWFLPCWNGAHVDEVVVAQTVVRTLRLFSGWRLTLVASRLLFGFGWSACMLYSCRWYLYTDIGLGDVFFAVAVWVRGSCEVLGCAWSDGSFTFAAILCLLEAATSDYQEKVENILHIFGNNASRIRHREHVKTA